MQTPWIFLCLSLVGCAGINPIPSEPDEHFLSVVQSPAVYDGKVVTIRGWVSLRDEDWNLWATWDDHENWRTNRCISLLNHGLYDDTAGAYDGREVTLTGSFVANNTEAGRIVNLGACGKMSIVIPDKHGLHLVGN